MLNLPLVGIFTSVLRAPRDMLVVGVLLVAVVGTYAARNNLADVVWLPGLGVLGYLMVKLGLSRAALMLAFVIAPLMERSLLQTLTLSGGDPLYLFGRPIAMTMVIATVLVVLAPLALRLLGRQRVTRQLDALADES